MLLRRISFAAAAVASASAQIQLRWSTDIGGNENGTYGPDGPWQAPILKLNGTEMPLWPGGSSVSEILTKSVGGDYTPRADTVKTATMRAYTDGWFGSVFMEAGWAGMEYWDSMVIDSRLGTSHEIKVNATLVAATSWNSSTTSNTTAYTPKVGTLGLGPRSEREDDTAPPGILQQLKASSDIDRTAFSVQMGSAALGIPGSLVLGGYEQNRALGQVGTFALQDSTPMMFLRDIIFDFQIRNQSLYPIKSNVSFWTNPTDLGMQYTKYVGGAAGSAVVVPNPVSPYIYLPPGICEAIAENLHMTYHNKSGLYLWETDLSAQLFVNQSAYLGFILADSSATNMTIKVPFQLLNLTLEPPLVEQKASYFPCKSINSSYGFWQLGRAFLQAAFLAVDYESNVTYMAQAPGPRMEQSIVKKFDGSAISTNPAESFVTTWGDAWDKGQVLQSFDTGDKGLAAGEKIGIAVGAEPKVLKEGSHLSELDSRSPLSEMGTPLSHEIESTERHPVRHEAPDDHMVYEMPADSEMHKTQ
ncbi:aspartic peptidase domain-containing protein [Colletotrichum acutatum]|uniref:Aspartic peptidase domain-containing protein n=1 Tax=Glomerella acutata TaxID=27357 RepID=A0AAD8U802_GLOAC|nr:aspartic peptidase domain-containing protein [Colletotrichum acutatum]KAK1711589.1 aspartic peptidase domain-containing protein [Colletotrichum acutatum]